MTIKDKDKTAIETIATWGWRIKKAGYSQRAFAKKFGFNESLLSQWINGKVNTSTPNFDKLELVLKKLKV
jgi:transcriptional regulator with XRE-family HTH domain